MENKVARRIRAEYIIVPAIAQARREAHGVKRLRTDSNYRSPSPPNPPTTPKQNFAERRPKPLVIYPGMDLEVKLNHPDSGQPYVVTGRVDLAAGYGEPNDSVFCVEGTAFWQVSYQLITYMAMCWYARREKANPGVQGFSTDGIRYEFSCIDSAGVIHKSKIFDTRDKEGIRTVYNWIISQLEAVVYFSPTTTPIEGNEKERKKDVEASQIVSRPMVYVDDEPGGEPQSFYEYMQQKKRECL
jgi:hypothetical protein